MRLSLQQAAATRRVVRETAGEDAEVYLFGSRLLDGEKGGDVDLLVVVPREIENPALLIARLEARISRALHGRRVDVIVKAPNLKQLPIHEIALSQGQRL